MATKKPQIRTSEPVNDAAARAAAELTELGATFALIGGLAVSVWSEPRYTRDVDLVVAVDGDEQAEWLIHALSARGYEIVTIIEQTKTKRLTTARLRRRDEHTVLIDLLFASSGIEPEIAADAAIIRGIPVGGVGALLALKVLSESRRTTIGKQPRRWCTSSNNEVFIEGARSSHACAGGAAALAIPSDRTFRLHAGSSTNARAARRRRSISSSCVVTPP